MHLSALLSAPPIAPNWKRRNATTMVAAEEIRRIAAVSGAKTIRPMNRAVAIGASIIQNLLETSRVFRSLSDATLSTPKLTMRAARSMLDGVVLLIDFQSSGCTSELGISILKPTLVTPGTTQH